MRPRSPSFFDRENQLAKIYELNGFLPKLKSLVDFEMFRDDLQQVREKERLSNAGRKPFDVVLMFKILVLKSLYNPHVLSQKDTDAEWAKKGDETHFGYKNHVAIDDEYKFIRGYGVTGAATHDSEPYLDLMPKEPAYPDQEAFADSAYKSKEIDEKLTERGFVPEIQGYRTHPLTEIQKESNKVKSSVRCRVEHVFGEMKMRMGNEVLRSIGFGRVRFWIGMRNLVYNMSRLVSLKRPKKMPKVAK